MVSTAFAQPIHLTLTGTGSLPLTYTPNNGFMGSDALTFGVTDALGDSSTATIS